MSLSILLPSPCNTSNWQAQHSSPLVKRQRLTIDDCYTPTSIARSTSRLITKGPWTPEEDQKLIDLVDEIGEQKWVVIAARLGTRSGKQARERWHNHLNPTLRKDPFTLEEEEKIELLYSQLGSKWADIAKHLPGRSDNAIKNYFNTCMTKRYRRVNGTKTPSRHRPSLSMQRSVSFQPYASSSAVRRLSFGPTPMSISIPARRDYTSPPKTPSPYSSSSQLSSSPLSDRYLPPPVWTHRIKQAPMMARTVSEPLPRVDPRMSLARLLS